MFQMSFAVMATAVTPCSPCCLLLHVVNCVWSHTQNCSHQMGYEQHASVCVLCFSLCKSFNAVRIKFFF